MSRVTALSLLIMMILPSCYTDLKQPCDERIIDRQAIQELILSNPVIIQLNTTLKFTGIYLPECFIKGEASLSLSYQLLSDMSSFGVPYNSSLVLAYSKGGHIDVIAQYTGERQAFDYENIMAMFRRRISFAEDDPSPRVKEFVDKIGPTQGVLNSCCWMSLSTIPPKPWAEIRYDPNSKLVIEYSLANSIEWREFSEIKMAHQIIENTLLVNNLSNCRIGREGGHSYTHVDFHDSETAPWFMTVSLICGNESKEAFLVINPNWSYERLEIR